jgi:hypothetical protein
LFCWRVEPRASTALPRLGFAVACLVAGTACGDSPGINLAQALKDAGAEADASTDETADPNIVADARVDDPEDVAPDDEADPSATLPDDAGAPEADASLVDSQVVDASNAPPVITAPPEVKQALCSDAYDSVKLSYSTVTRGSWQANPGGTFVKLAAPGYPCAAFLEEKKMRPADNDMKWTDAVDGAFLGFSEPSSISTTDYTFAQFRYFRSFIFVPAGANLTTLSVNAIGIDDSVYLELTNSRYPKGISPLDVGPSDPEVGACQGNGKGEWNLAKYMAEGEINVLLLVHADLAAATSTLLSVDVRADGAPIQLVSCKK